MSDIRSSTSPLSPRSIENLGPMSEILGQLQAASDGEKEAAGLYRLAASEAEEALQKSRAAEEIALERRMVAQQKRKEAEEQKSISEERSQAYQKQLEKFEIVFQKTWIPAGQGSPFGRLRRSVSETFAEKTRGALEAQLAAVLKAMHEGNADAAAPFIESHLPAVQYMWSVMESYGAIEGDLWQALYNASFELAGLGDLVAADIWWALHTRIKQESADIKLSPKAEALATQLKNWAADGTNPRAVPLSEDAKAKCLFEIVHGSPQERS